MLGRIAFSYAPMLGVVLEREAPVMSVVTPAIGVPAASKGEPNTGRKSVVEVNTGLAAMELASFPVAPCHAGKLVRSNPAEVAKLPMREKNDCAPLVKKSL